MDIVEISEAFSAQMLGCLKLMDVAFDDPRINPNDEAIAVGYPLAPFGAGPVLTAAPEFERSNGSYADVSLCIGVSQGLAVVIEHI